jgi:stringent starvation protein B
MVMNALESPSTRPYLIRAMYEWCTDHSFTPYVAVKVDGSVQVPREFVQGGEIVLNISFDATSSLQLGNEFIEFKARFGGKPCGMSFPVTDSPMGATVVGMDKLHKVPDAASSVSASSSASDADKPEPPPPSRPTLTRIK